MDYGFERYLRFAPSVRGNVEGFLPIPVSLAAGEIWISISQKTLFLGLLFLLFTLFPPIQVTDLLFLESTSEARTAEITMDIDAPDRTSEVDKPGFSKSSGMVSARNSRYREIDPEVQHPEGD